MSAAALTSCCCVTTEFAPAGELASLQADGLALGLDVMTAARRSVVIVEVRPQIRLSLPGRSS